MPLPGSERKGGPRERDHHAFLTGAARHIGSASDDRLPAGHSVAGLARSDAAVERLTAAGIQPVRGDLVDPASVAAGARAADATISTATTYDASIDGLAVGAMLGALAGSDKPRCADGEEHEPTSVVPA